MPDLRTLVAGLAAASVAALSTPAVAAAQTPTRGLSPFCENQSACAETPASVVDANGTSFTVWQRHVSDGAAGRSAIEGRTLSAANEIGPLQTIAAPLAQRPLLGALPRGGALIAWSQGWHGPLRARTRSADGTLGRVEAISGGAPALAPTLAANRAGQAVFTWAGRLGNGEPGLLARTRSASGVMSPIRELWAGVPTHTAAIGRTGDAVIAWSGWTGEGQTVHVRVLSADGMLGATEIVTPRGIDAGEPQVAVDYTGVARVVYGYEDPHTREWRLRLRTRSLDGTYDAERVLSAPGYHGHTASLAAGPGGGVELAWLHHAAEDEHPGPFSVNARTIRSNGTLTAAQDLGEGITPRIVAGYHGRSAVAYQRRYTDTEPSKVVAVRRRTATTLGPIESAPARAGHGAPPAIATNQAGHVAVAWRDHARSTLHPEGQYSRVFGRIFAP